MELTPMQYKSYVWPHNPRTYTIQYVRKVAVHKVPFGRYAMQDLGLGRRVMKGEGEFYGAGAYEEFKKLASVFYHSGPGTLIHPVWQSAKAYFVETLWVIARAWGMTLGELLVLNPQIKNPNVIQPGQRLRVRG